MVANQQSILSPTLEQFSAFQLAFDYLNNKLFDSKLKPCHLTFSRRAFSGVVFRPNVWKRDTEDDKLLHELCLNPIELEQPFMFTMSLVVRGMANVWQWERGTPSPSPGYCNRELADKLKEIGLQLSDSGKPGGRETGPWLKHYIIQNSPFTQAIATMPDDYKLPWKNNAIEKMKGSSDKIAYQCPHCHAKAWGKPGLKIACGCEIDCGQKWQPQSN